MNFSVTGEPTPSTLDQKRKTLLQSMLSSGPGAQRLLGGRGMSRGYTASDSPTAAVPGLTFNPFLAQLQRGASGIQIPTQQTRQSVDDLTGGAGGGPPAGVPGAGAAAGAGGGGATQPDLASLYAAAGLSPNATAGGGSGFFDQMSNQNTGGPGLFNYDPTQTPPPPVAPPIPYLRPYVPNVRPTQTVGNI